MIFYGAKLLGSITANVYCHGFRVCVCTLRAVTGSKDLPHGLFLAANLYTYFYSLGQADIQKLIS